MSEELNQEIQLETPEVTNTDPQPSEVEKRAMDLGWRPKEEFNGDYLYYSYYHRTISFENDEDYFLFLMRIL